MNKLGKGMIILISVFLFAVSPSAIALGQEIKIGVIGPMKFVQGIASGTGQPWPPRRLTPRGVSRSATKRC